MREPQVRKEAKDKVMLFEDRERSHKSRNAGSPKKLKKARRQILP